jgi:ADP-ribose pyrophosphatase YjhB (NUDIX family)
MSATSAEPDGRVVAIAGCELRLADGRWPWAEAHAAAIDTHWQRRQAENPAMFNGTILVMSRGHLAGDVLHGQLMRTDFKTVLFWKDQGYPDRTVRDAFGSALIVSAEGDIVLGRQAPGNLNAGLAYLPGGFIDQRDVAADGRVALEASIARELAEETGLDATGLQRQPGFIMTEAGALLSIAACYRAQVGTAELLATIRGHLAREPEPELEDVVAVRTIADLARIDMPVYARVLLAHLLHAK